MLEMKPHARLPVEDGVEEKIAAYSLMRRLHCSPDIARHALVLVRVDEHQTMVVITRQEQSLPRQATAAPRELADGRFVECAKREGQGVVDPLEMSHEAGAFGGVLGDGVVEGARGADCALDDAREGPHAADEGGVRRAGMVGRSIFILGQVLNSHVCVCACRREFDDDAEEGILHENRLPDFPSLLHLLGVGVWFDDGGVPVEAKGVGLSLENASECPGVGGMIVVHEEVGDEDHGLDGAHGGTAEVREHPEGLVGSRYFDLLASGSQE